MAKKFADRNFIGVDIKGARMWTGAKQSVQEGIANVAFLRTSIELIASFFEAGEVSEIWITFPDPQMQKVNKRLTSTRFMQLYRQILKDGGLVHLKTDSPFLYAYTDAMVRLNGFATEVNTDDLYHSGLADDILEIRTFYERQWLARGLTIKYINWHLDATTALQEPEIDIEKDTGILKQTLNIQSNNYGRKTISRTNHRGFAQRPLPRQRQRPCGEQYG